MNDKHSPSEIFMARWYFRVGHDGGVSPEMFQELAETWRELKNQEDADKTGPEDISENRSPLPTADAATSPQGEASPPEENKTDLTCTPPPTDSPAPERFTGPGARLKNETLQRLETLRSERRASVYHVLELSNGALTRRRCS